MVLFIATTETTTNIECNQSFRQSCKRKSERLKEKTRMVRHKCLFEQPGSHTRLNDGDVTHRDSFVGISNGKHIRLLIKKHAQIS